MYHIFRDIFCNDKTYVSMCTNPFARSKWLRSEDEEVIEWNIQGVSSTLVQIFLVDTTNAEKQCLNRKPRLQSAYSFRSI